MLQNKMPNMFLRHSVSLMLLLTTVTKQTFNGAEKENDT